MLWLDIAIIVSLIKVSKALNKCNGTVTKLQLCTIGQGYDRGTTGWRKLGNPVTLNTSITVFNIAEFDEDKSTMTLNILLSVIWNDVRITLESNDENE